jgi:AraC family transcriptional regulator
MDPVQKALWYVESHSRESITLEDIANACKVSPFHLTRLFAATMGLSLMRYVRARRMC